MASGIALSSTARSASEAVRGEGEYGSSYSQAAASPTLPFTKHLNSSPVFSSTFLMNGKTWNIQFGLSRESKNRACSWYKNHLSTCSNNVAMMLERRVTF